MPVIASAQAAAITRRRSESNGVGFWHTSFMGATRYRESDNPPPAQGEIYPVAFLVEQDPDCVVAAHFHQADQFQVVVAGSGRIGPHHVAPITVQYGGAFSAYGPIRAGAEGLHYLTLRNGWDPGARYMPAARTELPRSRRHHVAMAGPLAETAEFGCSTVLSPEPSGLAAWRWSLRENAALDGPDPAAGGGQFWVRLDGDFKQEGASIRDASCLFVDPGEPAFRVVAGGGGATVLVLQFPRRAR